MTDGGRGQMRVGRSARVSTVKPSGFCSSEAILDSSLLGVMPMEQPRPVAARTASLSRWASSTVSPGTSVRSMKISSMPRSSMVGASSATAALNSLEQWE